MINKFPFSVNFFIFMGNSEANLHHAPPFTNIVSVRPSLFKILDPPLRNKLLVCYSISIGSLPSAPPPGDPVEGDRWFLWGCPCAFLGVVLIIELCIQ